MLGTHYHIVDILHLDITLPHSLKNYAKIYDVYKH
jgi:hypothetical protein